MPSISRRQALLWMGSLLSAPVLANPLPKAVPGAPPSSSKPYDMINPPISDDKNRVRFFFAYDCPHCRSYHNGLYQWGQTLPKSLTFDAYPVITSPDNENLIIAVYIRLIAQAVAPKALMLYDQAMYGLLQGDPDAGTSPASRITVEDALAALVRSGANADTLRAYLSGNEVAQLEKSIPEHARVIEKYGIKATPSVAVAGRFLVNPDHTNGNAQQFLMLINGIISRLIEGGPHAV